MEITTDIQTAKTVFVGEYYLSPALKESFTQFVPFSGDEAPEGSDMKLHSGMYYITKDLFNPEVGDIRVQFYFSGYSGDIVSYPLLCKLLYILIFL